MNLTDRFGNPVSCRNRIALDLYDQAVTQLNFYRTDPIATIDEALAHRSRASSWGIASRQDCSPPPASGAAEAGIAAALDAAERHIGHALERERMHLNAARTWLSRDFAGAAKLYGDICAEYPRDLLALQIAHLFDFLLGHSSMLRDRPAQVLHAWGERDPQRGIVLGMHAFGLEECGAYDDAEAIGRRAMELSPADIWAAHAVTHVLEMRGQTHSGIEWIKNTAPGWSEHNFFAFHNWWHLALFHLDEEDYDSALAVYDTRIRPASTRVAGEMVDASALLWRLRLRNVDVGDRWTELARSWEQLGDDGYYAFNDVHALMAFLATGDQRQAQRILDGLGGRVTPPGHQRHHEPGRGTAHRARAVCLRTPGFRGGHRRIAARPAFRPSLRRQPCAARPVAAHHHRGGVSARVGNHWPAPWSANDWRSSRAANSTAACSIDC